MRSRAGTQAHFAPGVASHRSPSSRSGIGDMVEQTSGLPGERERLISFPAAVAGTHGTVSVLIQISISDFLSRLVFFVVRDACCFLRQGPPRQGLSWSRIGPEPAYLTAGTQAKTPFPYATRTSRVNLGSVFNDMNAAVISQELAPSWGVPVRPGIEGT